MIETGEGGLEDLILLGTDAVGLFPSLDSQACAALIRSEYESTDKFTIESGDWRELMRYIVLNTSRSRVYKEGLGRCCPWRTGTRGRAPGIKSINAKYQECKPEDNQFKFPKVEPHKWEIRRMVGISLEIGISTSFQLHTYPFGGRNYQQVKSGPIGARLTMAVARIIMQLWRRKVKQHLEEANLKVLLEGGYVDDMRHVISMMEIGWRWDTDVSSFTFKEEWRAEDAGLTRKEITEREVLRMMNSIFGFLTFTKETQDEFSDGYLPTLDTAIRLETNGEINYKYF